MHRAFSPSMERRYGEASKYVTKRMCFSLVLSSAFLFLLGGFLLGRYAIQRTLQIRADRTYSELAENGLKINSHLQISLLKNVEEENYDDINYNFYDETQADINDIQDIMGFFTSLKIFSNVIKSNSCIIATELGYREPDRYIVLSVSGDGIGLAVKLAEAFNKIYVEQNWAPRRTIIFCIFLGSYDYCKSELPAYTHSNVIAYLAIHGNAIQEKGYLTISGSDMIKEIIRQSIINVKIITVGMGQLIHNVTLLESENTFQRLAINMPHTTFSFLARNKNSLNIQEKISIEQYRRILAEIVCMTIWKLSESILLQWNPNNFYYYVNKAINTVNLSPFKNLKDRLISTVELTVRDIHKMNEKLDIIDKSKCLQIRMANDFLMKLDITLLCMDESLYSKTDLILFTTLPEKNADIISAQLNDIEICYSAADQLLQHFW